MASRHSKRSVEQESAVEPRPVSPPDPLFGQTAILGREPMHKRFCRQMKLDQLAVSTRIRDLTSILRLWPVVRRGGDVDEPLFG